MINICSVAIEQISLSQLKMLCPFAQHNVLNRLMRNFQMYLISRQFRIMQAVKFCERFIYMYNHSLLYIYSSQIFVRPAEETIRFERIRNKIRTIRTLQGGQKGLEPLKNLTNDPSYVLPMKKGHTNTNGPLIFKVRRPRPF